MGGTAVPPDVGNGIREMDAGGVSGAGAAGGRLGRSAVAKHAGMEGPSPAAPAPGAGPPPELDAVLHGGAVGWTPSRAPATGAPRPRRPPAASVLRERAGTGSPKRVECLAAYLR